MESFLDKIGKFIQAALMVMLVLLAVYSALGRQFVSHATDYQVDLELLLSEKLNGCVKLSSLQGVWNNFLPKIVFSDFKLFDKDFRGQCQDYLEPSLRLTSGSFTLDVVNSLLQKKLVLREVLINGLNVKVWQDIDQNWYLNELKLSAEKLEKTDPNYHKKQALPESVVNFLLSNQKISFFNSRLQLSTYDGDELSLDNIEFVLLNNLTRHTLAGRVINDNNSAQSLSFTIELEGDPRDVRDFKADIYVKHENLDLTKWAPIFIDTPDFEILNLQSSGQLWATFTKGRIQHVKGIQNMPKISWTVNGQTIPTLSYFSFNYEYTHGDTYESFNVYDLTFAWQDDLWSNSNLTFDVSQNGVKFKTDLLRLSLIHHLALAHMPKDESIFEILTALAPRGYLRDVEFILPFTDKLNEIGESIRIPDVANLHLRAQADSIAVDNYEFSPVIRNGNGFIKMNGLKGYVDIQTDNFTLGFPKLFHRNWAFEKGEGRLFFDLTQGLRLSSNILTTQSKYGAVKSKLDIVLPRGDEPAYMGLMIGSQQTTADITSDFLPKFLPDSFHHYLGDQSGLNADISEVVFFYNGSIDPKVNIDDLNIQVKTIFEDAKFKFLPDWPSFVQGRGQFLMNNDTIKIDIGEAKIARLAVADGHVDITSLYNKPTMQVTGSSSDTVERYLDFVRSTPLDTLTKGIFSDWQATGVVNNNLKIDLNLFDVFKINETKLFTSLVNGSLIFPEQNIILKDITGDFHFDLHQGVSAKEIKATILNVPSTLKLKHHDFLGENETLNIQVLGQVKVLELSKFLRQDLTDYLSGTTNYHLDINFRKTLQRSTATFTSDLSGMKVLMPAPFALEAGETQAFSFQTTFDPRHGEYQFKYGQVVKGEGNFEGRNLKGAQIILGEDVAPIQKMDDKFHVHGNIDYLNVDEWRRYISGISSSGIQISSQVSYFNKARLNQLSQFIGESSIFIETMVLDTDEVSHVSLQAASTGDDWVVNVDTALLKGFVLYQPSQQLPFNINVQYADIDGLLEIYELDESTQGNTQINIIPQKLPGARLNFSSLVYHQVDLGEMKFEVLPNEQGAVIQNIKGNIADLNIDAHINWRHEAGEHQTKLDANITTQALGKIFVLLGKQPFIQSKDASFYFNWGWADSPHQFELAKVFGYSEFDVKSGLVRISNAAADVSKVLGLINVDSMLKSFNGDFKDFYGDGVVIEKLGGQIDLQGGHATIVDSLVFEGPSIKTVTRGEFDIQNEALNLDVTVTLPLAGNVPAIALVFFYFGAPFVAGYYITEKLIGDQLEQFTSARYDVVGAWDNPGVKVRPLFSSDKEKERMLNEIQGSGPP